MLIIDCRIKLAIVRVTNIAHIHWKRNIDQRMSMDLWLQLHIKIEEEIKIRIKIQRIFIISEFVILFRINTMLRSNIDWSTSMHSARQIFIPPLKEQSCPARSELLHLESIKWIKIYQWNGRFTFVFFSVLLLTNCWQLLLLPTSFESSRWNCSRTREDCVDGG